MTQRRRRVAIVLTGHEHTYERVLIDGAMDVVWRLSGAGRYGFGKPAPGSMTRFAGYWGALRLDIRPESRSRVFIGAGGVARDASPSHHEGGALAMGATVRQ